MDVKTNRFRLQNLRTNKQFGSEHTANRRPFSIAFSCRPSWARTVVSQRVVRPLIMGLGKSPYNLLPLHSPKVTVQWATSKRVVIVSYFFEENGFTVTVNADRYINDFHQRLSRTKTAEKAFR